MLVYKNLPCISAVTCDHLYQIISCDSDEVDLCEVACCTFLLLQELSHHVVNKNISIVFPIDCWFVFETLNMLRIS